MDHRSGKLLTTVTWPEAHRRADLDAAGDGLANDRCHNGFAAIEHAQQVLTAVDLFFRRSQNIPDAALGGSDDVGCMESIEASLLLSKLVIQADHALVTFRQGLSQVAGLLLKLVHALH